MFWNIQKWIQNGEKRFLKSWWDFAGTQISPAISPRLVPAKIYLLSAIAGEARAGELYLLSTIAGEIHAGEIYLLSVLPAWFMPAKSLYSSAIAVETRTDDISHSVL